MTIEITDTGACAEMPRYQCHKKVWALKIAAIEFTNDGSAMITPADAGYAAFMTSVGYCRKCSDLTLQGHDNDPEDLGYYVRYADGYESWSPTKAFEDGYTPLASVGTTGGV